MSNYRYYNRNPANNHINDCVCRAISNCTGLSYGAVDRLLATTAKDNECENSVFAVMINYLNDWATRNVTVIMMRLSQIFQ